MKTPWNETPRPFRLGRPNEPHEFPAAVAGEYDITVPYVRTQEHPLEVLKNRLLREVLSATQEAGLLAPVRRAANEAAALAWMEPFPLLVFPELFAEKILTANSRVRQQRHVRTRTARLLEAFA